MSFLLRRKFRKLLFLGLGLYLLCAQISLIPVYAQSSRADIAQGFEATDSSIAPGALVSLKPNNANAVELANKDRTQRLIGIVGERPLIDFSSDTRAVSVVTTGVTSALVSDVGGEVKNGDKITASPIDGVGMKAAEGTTVVGVAQADLGSVKKTTQTIKKSNGQVQQVNIGVIPVQVDVAFFGLSTPQASYVPAFLQEAANAIAGRQVSPPIRAFLAALTLFVALLSVAVLLYSAVHSSIISLGRNPLSELAVRKGLLLVGASIVAILFFTPITIYLILVA